MDWTCWMMWLYQAMYNDKIRWNYRDGMSQEDIMVWCKTGYDKLGLSWEDVYCTGLEPVENKNQGNSWLTHIHSERDIKQFLCVRKSRLFTEFQNRLSIEASCRYLRHKFHLCVLDCPTQHVSLQSFHHIWTTKTTSAATNEWNKTMNCNS